MKRLVLALPAVAVLAALAPSCTTSSKKESSPTATGTATIPCGGVGILCNVAGQAGLAGSSGDGGPAIDARLYWPQYAFEDASGNALIIDWNNYLIRRIDASGMITRILGSGINGDSCGVPALQANMNHPPQAVFSPFDGNLYIATWHNHRVKRLNFSNGLVECLYGTGAIGFSGDGGPAATAVFSYPNSVDFDSAGNLYIMDAGNQRIRRVDTSGNITTVVGSGVKGCLDSPTATAAQMSHSYGQNSLPGGRLRIDQALNVLYFTDMDHTTQPSTTCSRVRKWDMTSDAVTTVAGTGAVGYTGDGGSALSATLHDPQDIAIAPDHSLYIADTFNHVVRRVDYVTGVITTVAGTGQAGVDPDRTPATQARLYAPGGVWISPSWTLYIADTFNHQVKKIRLQ